MVVRQGVVVIKLGGSVVTDKEASRSAPRTNVIRSLAGQIKSVYKSSKWKIILVHGAGSFGHPLAKKYNLQHGMRTPKQKVGFCLTDQKMLRLNSIIMSNLLKCSIPAVSLPPRAFVCQSGGKLKILNHELIRFYLEHDQVPVLFGDVVLDDKWGCFILSGDIIVSYLARKLKASKVVFLSDVDGIYEKDPKVDRKASKIDLINGDNLEKVLDGIAQKNPTDVTGEMRGKILAIKKNLKRVEVIITSGLLDGNLTSALRNQRIGTRLFFR